MSERAIIRAGHYDLAAPSIRCVADAIGFAHIFTFPGIIDGDDLLVLAHDSREAADVYFNECKRVKKQC